MFSSKNSLDLKKEKKNVKKEKKTKKPHKMVRCLTAGCTILNRYMQVFSKAILKWLRDVKKIGG